MRILIVALEYLEPEYEQTRKCIEETGLNVLYVSRDGVGNMSRAFNSVIEKRPLEYIDYIWFITNITFANDTPLKLAECLEDNDYAAVHPAMNSSDHIHMHKGNQPHNEVPFVELTAPMFRAKDWVKYMFDEKLPYYYMDLDICHRMRLNGLTLGLCSEAEVSHIYLRNAKTKHPISRIRAELRNYHTPGSYQHMTEKWGNGWEKLLNWKK